METARLLLRPVPPALLSLSPRRPAVVAVAVFLLMLSSAGLVSAHARYVSSIPDASATVGSAPASVTIVFTNPLVAGSTGAVTDPAGATVSTGSQVATSDPDRKTLTMPLRSGLPSGVYKVSYTSRSEDGAGIEGSFAFGVGAPVPASMAKTEQELVGHADHATAAGGSAGLLRGGLPFGALAGAGAALALLAVVGVAIAAAVARTRRRV